MLSAHVLSGNGTPPRPIKFFSLRFPGGEEHISIEANAPVCGTHNTLLIKAHLDSSAEIMALLLLTDALRHAYPGQAIHLDLPYVPYGRQDRLANPGEALSLRVFCDLINSQEYATVGIIDPHSDVTPALLRRVKVTTALPYVTRAISQIGPLRLICPDAGARKKIAPIARRFELLPVMYADKIRDTQTGEITGTTIDAGVINDRNHDTPLLVIDDICDGGRTFIELAKAVRETGLTGPLYLYVTHGIFSKGVEPLLEYFEKVFTTHDWTRSSHPRVVIL